jgi:hypothetical protein
MGLDLIKQTRSGFKQNIKKMLRNTWLSSSLLMSLVLLTGEMKSEEGPLIFSVLAHLFTSIAFGFVMASTATFPLACIAFFQFFVLKQKIIDNEHMKSSAFVKINQSKNTFNKVGEFFFGIEKVNVLELNGKKLSQPVRAILLYKLKKNQLTGSMIQFPFGCFFIPHPEVQSSSSKKVA